MGHADIYSFLFNRKSAEQEVQDVRSAFKQLESVSLAVGSELTEETTKAIRARVRRIEWIQIKNIKALGDVRIDIPPSDNTANSLIDPASLPGFSTRASWRMLLGENATGKSTLLKVVALALVGREYQERLQDPPATYVRQGCQSGWVKVKLSGNHQPITLQFSAEGLVQDFDSERAQTLLLGYGTTQLLQNSDAPQFSSTYARIDNLFDLRVPLINVELWLEELRLREPDKFEEARQTLGRVLLFEGNERVFYDTDALHGRLKVCLKDAVVTLEQLSDGYRTVLTLTADIMSVLLRIWPTVNRAEGIVLIDELGNHLHPRWKMHLIDRLRTAFPKVQFIATTHDPLCLRGLEDGEVVVLRRNARGHVYSVTDLPPVRSMRVDQILTSEHFGLSSTQDPESEAFFREYYAMLAKRRRTAKDEALLETMREELPKYGVAGKTRRERLMLEAIDFHLAIEQEIEGKDQRRASQEALSQVLGRILGDEPV